MIKTEKTLEEVIQKIIEDKIRKKKVKPRQIKKFQDRTPTRKININYDSDRSQGALN